MKYTLRQLDKAATLINQIKELDASIINLDQLAQKVSEHSISYDLKVSGELKTEKENILDSDGSLRMPNYRDSDIFASMLFGTRNSKPKPDNTLLDLKLSDSELLTVIGTLLSFKYQQREALKEEVYKLEMEIDLN